MRPKFDNTLVIAISSRALFDLTASHRIYEEQGIDAYCRCLLYTSDAADE